MYALVCTWERNLDQEWIGTKYTFRLSRDLMLLWIQSIYRILYRLVRIIHFKRSIYSVAVTFLAWRDDSRVTRFSNEFNPPNEIPNGLVRNIHFNNKKIGIIVSLWKFLKIARYVSFRSTDVFWVPTILSTHKKLLIYGHLLFIHLQN